MTRPSTLVPDADRDRRGPGCLLALAALTVLIWVCMEGAALLIHVVIPGLFAG
jgi:hypothetical protein